MGLRTKVEGEADGRLADSLCGLLELFAVGLTASVRDLSDKSMGSSSSAGLLAGKGNNSSDLNCSLKMGNGGILLAMKAGGRVNGVKELYSGSEWLRKISSSSLWRRCCCSAMSASELPA